ncbi:hypothetical protein [Hymenobacter volaticus]|uniref:Uncharacterized protein n=1 Tax=Hymenobacter volaticus TaxID=2932254 RepID=A0ABY4G2J3_9BACT|nr:hypothetical protein [Hymenobacter volaticus]UOQ64879.1 hypothetical protein MUN86_15050 [Hymenobacter volaticus]
MTEVSSEEVARDLEVHARLKRAEQELGISKKALPITTPKRRHSSLGYLAPNHSEHQLKTTLQLHPA